MRQTLAIRWVGIGINLFSIRGDLDFQQLQLTARAMSMAILRATTDAGSFKYSASMSTIISYKFCNPGVATGLPFIVALGLSGFK
jgi:hypothetical protein